MAKQEKKSIADLISSKSIHRKPSSAEIDKITPKIHEAHKVPSILPVPMEKVKRISVNAPVSLYLKAKTKATLQDQTLMAYIIGLIETDAQK